MLICMQFCTVKSVSHTQKISYAYPTVLPDYLKILATKNIQYNKEQWTFSFLYFLSSLIIRS